MEWRVDFVWHYCGENVMIMMMMFVTFQYQSILICLLPSRLLLLFTLFLSSPPLSVGKGYERLR
jgi:hypothetical protein